MTVEYFNLLKKSEYLLKKTNEIGYVRFIYEKGNTTGFVFLPRRWEDNIKWDFFTAKAGDGGERIHDLRKTPYWFQEIVITTMYEFYALRSVKK